jgi:hypothetical protein
MQDERERRFTRYTTQLAITAVLATALSVAVPVFMDRREYAEAVLKYAKNPSPDNEANLRIATAKNQGLTMISRITVAGLLFVLMNTGWWLVKRRSH